MKSSDPKLQKIIDTPVLTNVLDGTFKVTLPMVPKDRDFLFYCNEKGAQIQVHQLGCPAKAQESFICQNASRADSLPINHTFQLSGAEISWAIGFSLLTGAMLGRLTK